jgi:hypoxanthine phosphoribosyltransferase
MSQLKLTKLFDEKEINKRVRALGEQIGRDYKEKELFAVCILKGSFVFYADLVRQIDADIKCEFLGVSSYSHSMKSSGEVKLTLDLTNAIEGRHVLLIEDIVDTGLTMSFLKETLAARKPKSLKTAAMLLKPEALKAEIKVDYLGFEIANDFVVGYGLDYQGYYRNLPYIARVNNFQ